MPSGCYMQLGRLWGACCVRVWATDSVGRASSHVWGTQNDNCSGPACPAALVPLPTAPAAGSCLCIKGPGQGHEGSWACRLPSLTQTRVISAVSVADELGQPRKSTFSTLSILVQGQRCKSHMLLTPLRPPPAACRSGPGGHCPPIRAALRILIHAARSCPCPRASPAHTCVLACLSFQSIHALTGCLSLSRDLHTARIASHAYISPNAGQACSHAPKMQPQSATAAAADQSDPSYTTVLPRASRQGGVLLPRHVCSRCWTADASNFFLS